MNASMSSARRAEDLHPHFVHAVLEFRRYRRQHDVRGSVASIWLKNSVQENVRWSISAFAPSRGHDDGQLL